MIVEEAAIVRIIAVVSTAHELRGMGDAAAFVRFDD